MTTTAEQIEAVAAELGLTMRVEFVPWSQSRNAGEKLPSLNWKVRILKSRPEFSEPVLILTTDYMAGCGHCPSYKQGANSISYWEQIKRECETGKQRAISARSIEPKFADVLHSLASDASALDAATFEDWATECGWDSDSRKAEAVYRVCLDIGLKLRAALGESGLERLRAAVADY